MKRIFLILATLAALAGCAPKAAPIKTCIFPGDYPDPSILRDGKDFYMTHSSFTYFPVRKAPGASRSSWTWAASTRATS